MLLDISLHSLRQALPSGLLLLLCLVFFSILPSEGLVLPHLINSGHALVFGLATYVLLLVIGSQRPLNELLYILLFCLLVGLSVELIQPYVGRERSLMDFIYDFLGCSAALLWYLAKFRTSSRRHKTIMRGLALALVASSLAYPAYRWYVKLQADASFPLIADFESFGWPQLVVAKNGSDLELSLAPESWDNNTQVGKLRFKQGALYPGMRFAYLYRDWQGFERLSFELYSEANEVMYAVLRIHDRKHQNQYRDRFKRKLRITPGLNRYLISLKDVKEGLQMRAMEMGQIADMMLYMHKPEQERTIYIDNIRLERN